MSAPIDRSPEDPSKARQRIARNLQKVARELGRKPRRPIGEQPSPLALFPLRLEYRVIEAGRPVVHARTSAESLRIATRTGHSDSPARDGRRARTLRHLEFIEERPVEREIWWRWFPDDPFAAQGVPPISQAETDAVARFRNAIGSSSWWDVTKPEVCAAFAALAQQVGAWRALHLLRGPQAASANWEQNIGKLAVLPERVALYAIAGHQLTELGVGAPISADLRLSPAQLRPGGWLVDFAVAVDQGMGLRLREAAKVTAAFNADWIVAIGLGAGDATSALERFLADASANGNVELVTPGTPTNRVAGRPPAFEREPADPAAFLKRSTVAERSGSMTIPADGSYLSAAFGIDPPLLDRVTGARAAGRESIKAMSSVLLPGLTDGLFRTVPELGAERPAVLEFLCEHAASRGPFSPVRFGHTPYGILPVTALDSARAPASSPKGARDAFAFCSRVASASIAWLETESHALPIVRPDDPQAHEKLDEALRLHPVSLRAVVRNLPGSKAFVLRCPLVRGAGFDPGTYLRQLADLPLLQLPNPDDRDLQTPLLYRLVRFSREVSEQQVLHPARPTSGLTATMRRGPANSTVASAKLAEALHMLANVAPSELERLLLEVLDFLDHRADAWFTALATSRLKALRAAQPRGLRAGWYGFLGRLRAHPDFPTQGFIQAPSLAQATTAAILRAAALRHPGGAFEIDLSSRRARRAVRLLDELRQGAELGQALGNVVARQLHDAGQDFVLHLLRAAYPLKGNAPQGFVAPLDGVALHDDASLGTLQATSLFAGLTQAERARTVDRASRARAQVAEALDGVADLVMAEAAHQLTLGNAGAANAWMQVLSGDPPPHELVFLRTPRDAQGSTYRWAFVREPSAAAGANPRALIEPSVAALASELLTGFQTCGVGVVLTVPDGSEVRRTLLLRDLGMEPIDVVIGGENEVRLRARFAIWRRWRVDSGLQTELGSPPVRDVVEQLSSTFKFRIDATASANGAPTLEALLRLVPPLVDLLAASRPLRPQDLSAVAAVAPQGTDLVAAIREAALGLASRCSTGRDASQHCGDCAARQRRCRRDSCAAGFARARAVGNRFTIGDPGRESAGPTSQRARGRAGRVLVLRTAGCAASLRSGSGDREPGRGGPTGDPTTRPADTTATQAG